MREVCARVATLLIAALIPAAASAQARAEVVLSADAVGPDTFGILASAFARDGVALVRGGPVPRCSGTLNEADVYARVWVSWAPRSGADVLNTQPLQLCFQDHCRSSERGLDAFATLDARAREELITVIESGLEALRATCVDGKPEAEQVAASPNRVLEGPHEAEVSGGSRAVSTPGPEVAPPPRVDRESGPGSSTASAQASAAPDNSVSTPPTAAEIGEPLEKGPEQPRLAFVASYGFTRWTEPVLAQRLSGMVAYAIDSERPVYLGIELSYAPQFHVLEDDLAVYATSVRVAVELMVSWPLYRRLMLVTAIGPAIEWLSLEPDARTTHRIIDPRSTSHGDPLLFARLGPALRVYGNVSVGLDVQLDTAWMAREFGFTSVEGPVRVFAPDRVRLSIALSARAQL
jgi:hypothetical protein